MASVSSPSTRWSATEDSRPVMCDVYCPTARKPPALVAPATKASTAPRRMLAWVVRSTSVQPRMKANIVPASPCLLGVPGQDGVGGEAHRLAGDLDRADGGIDRQRAGGSRD